MYQKEIIYMGLYKDGNRMGSAGFLKVENRGRESRLYLKIQNIPLGISGRFPIRVYNGNDWKEINGITVQDGGGNWEENLTGNVNKAMIQIMLSGGYLLEGKSKSAVELKNTMEQREDMEPVSSENPKGNMEPQSVTELWKDTEPLTRENPVSHNNSIPQRVPEASPQIIITEELPRHTSCDTEAIPENISVYPLKEDKWEQILDTYEKIHPYGDERVYVKLEPKDFVILQSKYQHLVNNSFLLHGFYNYRYVILGKEQDYYLGVPGVFYEREKMVALMFGFEAFECTGGNAKAGEFGYYLRKVEL